MQSKQVTLFFAGTLLALLVGIYLYKNYYSHKPTPPPLSPEILQEVTVALSKTFNKPIAIKSVALMSEPDRRNLVVRIMLDAQDQDVPKTVIFKQSLERDVSNKDDLETMSRFTHEWAGAEFVNTLPNAAQLTFSFYGGNKTHRFILLEDLGEKHLSLVDYLKANDPQAATTMLGKFMERLGQLHANSYGRTDEYLGLLHAINPTESTWQEELKKTVEETLLTLETTLKRLEIPYTQELQQEAVAALTAVIAPGQFTTLIHGDCCPDNDFIDQKTHELKLIDFEVVAVRSALLDGVYPRMRFPSCWFVGVIPDNVIDSIETIYRQELIKKIPAAQNDADYYEAYVNACAYWMFTVCGIKKVWDTDEHLRRPKILNRLQTFITVATKHNKLPRLRHMAEQILQAAQAHWPETKPLEFYPAYKK